MKVSATTHLMANIRTHQVTDPGKIDKTQRPQLAGIQHLDPILKDAHTQLASMPEVDQQGIAAMKAAIAAGENIIDLDKLTDALCNFHQK